MASPSRPTTEAAEMLAISALSFLAEEPDRLGRFLAMTGLSVEQIRGAARAPGFLAGVLEHMLAEENLLLAFAAGAGIDPASVARAHRVLSGQWEREVP